MPATHTLATKPRMYAKNNKPQAETPRPTLAHRLKWAFDRLFGIVGLAACTPLLLLIALLVRLDSKGNPFFMQVRVGRGGRLFTIFKIRTLFIEHFGVIADQNEPSAHRITRLGRYLRRSKLDELPQLLNIALGHMSFVGPRPIAYDYFKLIEMPGQRHLVRPGLTGLTQVSGNLALPWQHRMWLDGWYVANWSLRLDLKILFLTCAAVAHGEQAKDHFNLLQQLPSDSGLVPNRA